LELAVHVEPKQAAVVLRSLPDAVVSDLGGYAMQEVCVASRSIFALGRHSIFTFELCHVFDVFASIVRTSSWRAHSVVEGRVAALDVVIAS